MSINDCKLIELPKIMDQRGNLTFIESQRHMPFEIQRVYYLYDVPNMAQRGGHAHKNLQQLILCLSGSFDVILGDGFEKKIMHLDCPSVGLHVVSGIWRELVNFSANSICLVLASDFYREDDYFRNYDDFLKSIKTKTSNNL